MSCAPLPHPIQTHSSALLLIEDPDPLRISHCLQPPPAPAHVPLSAGLRSGALRSGLPVRVVSQPSPTGPRQLLLCLVVPQPSLGFSFPNLASEEVQIPPLCPKTSRGALCVLEYTSCSSSSSGKSKNGRFLTASLWFLFPKPYSFSQGHKAPVVPEGSCPHLESWQQSRLGRFSLGSEGGSAQCLRPCTLLPCGNSSG